MKACVLCFGFEKSNLRLQPWRYVFEMSRAVKRVGWRVIVLTDVKGYEKEGISVKTVPNFRHFGKYSADVIKAVEDMDPDVVIQLVGATSGIFGPRQFKTPTIGIMTSPLYTIKDIVKSGIVNMVKQRQHLFGAFVWRSSAKALAKQNDSIIVLSDDTKAKLLRAGVKANIVRMVPAGIDGIFRPSIPPAKCRDIVYLGSDDPIRGLDTLLAAWRLVSNKTGKLELLIRKTGAKGVRKLCMKEYNISAVLGCMNPSDIYRHIKKARAVALPFRLVPSDVPIAILEGMASGKPVISTAVGSIPELLEGRGLVVEPNNPKQLAAAIGRICTDDALADRLGNAAAAFAAKQSWKRSGKLFVKVVRGLV